MEEIGRQLRAAREARGISVEQAEEETKIRRKYLEALETGTKSDLPGEVYLKGFLRTYGNYLGLDGPALVEEYKLATTSRRPVLTGSAASLAPTTVAAADADDSPADRARQLVDRERPRERPARPPEDTSEIKPAVIRPGPSNLRTRKDGTPRPIPKRSGARVRGVVLLLMVAAILGGIGYYGWKVVSQFTNGSDPAPDKQPATTQTQGTTTPTPPAPTTPTTPAPPAPEPVKVTMTKGEGDQYLFAVNAKEVTLRIETTQRTWVQAMAGDKLLYDNFPVAPQEFRGANLRIRLGHMIGVTLYINGEKYDTGLKEGPYTFVFSGN